MQIACVNVVGPTATRCCRRQSYHGRSSNATSQLARLHNMGSQRQRRCKMPLWDAPQTWLQLLVNDEELLDLRSLQRLMSASWAMCRAVLRCMQRWRLRVLVRSRLHACKWPLVSGEMNSKP